MDYDNTNTGVLFKNESDNDKAPAYRGKINVAGKDFELAAWIRTSKSGQKFMSLKVQEPFKKGDSKPVETDTPFDDSDIPF